MIERLKELSWVVWSAILIIIIIIIFAFFDLFYDSFFGVKHADNQRKIFEHSQSYEKGMANDLSKYKYELSTEKDVTARKAIIDLIIDKYGDFDETTLTNESLKQFLIDVRNGSIQ